jgi:hypothetical protein
MRRRTPIGALVEGLIAGAVGAGVQTLFLKATEKRTPKPPPNAFIPPEPIQKEEQQTETVARRLVEQLAQRGPLSDEAKRRGGALVHYGFGAAWGGLYGLLRQSYPPLRRPRALAGFSLAVWIVGDELALPLFRLAGWPHKYPPKTHLHAAAAHLAYGAGMGATFAMADNADLALLGAALVYSRGRAAARKAVARSRALVPRQMMDGPRRLAEALARRAHDLH